MFEELDFVYTPSRDVAADISYAERVLGAEVLFAIEGMGTRVAALRLTERPPLVLLADHVEGERPFLVFRVGDLSETTRTLEARGWKGGATLEIPHGPCLSFETPSGHRFALYELTRPEAAGHFQGRRDF
jgi:hypothetical protein